MNAMSNDRHYLEQVAAMRQQRAADEIALERNQAVLGYQESLANRQQIEQEAAVETDPNEKAALVDSWHYYDSEVPRCEQDIQRLTPPQANPRQVKFMQRRAPFIERHGQQAVAAMDMAHRYATAPRAAHPNPTKVGAGNHGMGLRPDTPAYYRAMDDLLTMYSKD